MKLLVFGSLNIDNTYDVDHTVKQGETISSLALNTYCGGKGLNQAIAVSKAGADTYHAGCIGTDGNDLVQILKDAGVHTELIKVDPSVRSGHTIIQRDKDGDNCIILYGGANQAITKDYVDKVLTHFEAGDFLILQNEINELAYVVEKAAERGLQVVLNPSPMNEIITGLDLSKVSYLILNEIEASQILDVAEDTDPDQLLDGLMEKFPSMKIVLTLGKKGSVYCDQTKRLAQSSFSVPVVDTTGAGDTFLGYFIASSTSGMEVAAALERASKAAAIAVGSAGAAQAIPTADAVERF